MEHDPVLTDNAHHMTVHYGYIQSAFLKALDDYPAWNMTLILCSCAECRSAYASGWASRLNEEMWNC